MGMTAETDWPQGLAGVLLTAEEIAVRVTALAQEITTRYYDKHPLLIGVLKGSFVFLADLIRQLHFPLEIDFVSCESYGLAAQSSGQVRLRLDVARPVTGRHLLLVEDIVDTGLTLAWLRERLLARQPASLAICCLLNKPSRRQIALPLDYVGFEIPDVFVVGYGLDYAERYRGLPYVAIVAETEDS